MKTTLINSSQTQGFETHREILQQPDLWPDTVERVRNCRFRTQLEHGPVFLTGAGTSAYAATAIEAAWSGARHCLHGSADGLRVSFARGGSLLSLARSGDSPESLGVIDRLQRSHPQLRHFAITCNSAGGSGHPARRKRAGPRSAHQRPQPGDDQFVLQSRRSPGLCFYQLEALQTAVARVSEGVPNRFAKPRRRRKSSPEPNPIGSSCWLHRPLGRNRPGSLPEDPGDDRGAAWWPFPKPISGCVTAP